MKTRTDALLQAWYHDTGPWVWPCRLLRPLALAYRALAAVRRRWQQARAVRQPVPVIIVGNLAVGGTGKTPLLLALAEHCLARGWRVGVVSRGYGGQYDGLPREVYPGDRAADTGDEPLLIARRLVPGGRTRVMIAHDRAAAVQALCAGASVDVVLADDGLQHYRLARDIEIAVLDGARGLGNGWCLPAGPLREPPGRLASVSLVVTNGPAARVYREDQVTMQVQPVAWQPLDGSPALPLAALKPGTRVHAVAGIGNPARFFATVRSLGLVVEEHPFPDHHAYCAADLSFADGLPVVMTEKDAVKCAGLAPPCALALQVNASLPEGVFDRILQSIGNR